MLPRLMSWHCCLGLSLPLSFLRHYLSVLESYEAAAPSEYDYDVMYFVILHVRNFSDSLLILFGTNKSTYVESDLYEADDYFLHSLKERGVFLLPIC